MNNDLEKTVILMAKPAAAGRVKTRLIPALGAAGAAQVHQAMLACVLERVERYFDATECELLLALAREPADRDRQDLQSVRGGAGEAEPVGPRWRVIDQGGGDLGERMLRCWRSAKGPGGGTAPGGGPVVFLGADCPDVPGAALRAAAEALGEVDVAVGPAADGGYWTLAARRCEPALLEGIDWGTGRVYDQTRSAAGRAGLSFRELPRWFDVDEPADLLALVERLRVADDPALLRLRRRLETILRQRT